MKKLECSFCSYKLPEIPLCYAANAPYHYYVIAEEELESRTELNKDFCVIDNQFFFIRGNIEIPIIDSDEVFVWTVWVSLSETNFLRANDLLLTEGRESEEPYFGWLSTEISIYPTTVNLKTNVHTREVGLVPLIDLEPTDHPLAIEQRTGITMERVKEFAHLIMHNQ